MIFPVKHLPQVIPIGIQTENGVESIGFDVKPWLDEFDGLELSIWPTRPGENAAYRVADENMELVGTVLYWHLVLNDTAIAGNGKVEILGITGDKRKLSGWCETNVKATSLAVTQNVPEAARPWVDEVLDAAKHIKESIVNVPYISDHGTWMMWDAAAGEYVDSGTSAKGKDGLDGKDGRDGIDGQDGDTRVYVGSDEPPEDAEVWIDPEGAVSGSDLPAATETEPGAVILDTSLTKSGAAADAKTVGDKFTALTEEMVKSINGIKPDENGNITLPIYNGEGEVV